MISLRVNAFKDLFFDRPAVRRAADDATWKSLSRSAFLVRTIAQRSMRYRKWSPAGGGSAPGQPPYARTGRGPRDALVRKFLFAGLDPRERVAVVGPALLDSTTWAQRTLEFLRLRRDPTAGAGGASARAARSASRPRRSASPSPGSRARTWSTRAS